jgi:phosphatidylglycerophosphatase A
MSRILVYAVGTLAGTGYAPVAPATAASLAVALVWWLVAPVPLWLQACFLAGTAVLGVPIAARIARERGEDDPRCVVIDEVAGMLVTYLGVATGPAGWLAGFLWFRVFDIVKPFPVRRLERLPGGLGIMADDLLAGVYAAVALRLTLHWTGW